MRPSRSFSLPINIPFVFHSSELVRWAALFAALLIGLGMLPRVSAQSDDFNDGNDTGWVHFGLSVVGAAATYSFPDDGFGGKAYRIQSPAPPVPNAGPARSFSYRTNVYSDFYAAVDAISWDNSLNQAFGFLFRGANIGLGTTDGYVMNYDPNQGSGGRGQIQINAITDEVPTTITAANISLVPTQRYRFVLTAVGNSLTGQIYDFNDLTQPLVTINAPDDSSYGSGVAGLFHFSRVNAANYTNTVTGKADSTFDNYLVSTAAPGSVAFPATPHPIPDMPQVVERTPQAGANFYPYTNGISFTATTLTTNVVNTNAIKLYLNGADVSPGLSMSGTVSNVDVTFNGLDSNTVYDARIVLADLAGRVSTNEFTFDTFDQSYFDSPGVKIIEAEDYNFDSGQFQDNPPPSGVDSAGGQVNGGGVGYFDLAGASGVDYFDRSSSAGSGTTPEYRTQDFVGTQAGTAAEVQPGPVLNDTIRQKYATNSLPEYEVRRTEGGEWLNYTRVFSNGNYNVYLRAACRAPQAVILDAVTSDPSRTNQTTSPLGVFNVPSTGLIVRYRYVPLTDTNGNLAVLNLSATNTLRLTLGGPQTNVTQQTMTLNYMAFLPAQATVPQPQPTLTTAVVTGGNLLFSLATANAITYTVQYKDSLTQSNWVDSTTIVGNGTTRTVTNAVVGTSRFFRVSAH